MVWYRGDNRKINSIVFIRLFLSLLGDNRFSFNKPEGTTVVTYQTKIIVILKMQLQINDFVYSLSQSYLLTHFYNMGPSWYHLGEPHRTGVDWSVLACQDKAHLDS